MKLLTIFATLAIAASAYGSLVQDDVTDKQMFLRIIECAQKAVITGLPEADIPSHDPLVISKNFSYALTLGSYSFEIALENMYMEGIPWWEVTQMDDLTEVADTPVFNYTIYWKVMSFEGTWKASLVHAESGDQVFANEGGFGFEFDHLDFYGIFNFSKPENDHEPGFNSLTLHFHTKESKLHVDNLGLVSTIIELLGGQSLTTVVNLDLVADVMGPGLRDRFNTAWIAKPERIQAIMSNCDSS